jgi:hypothetical protein
MLKVKMKDYGVKAVLTMIIDGKINVTGISDFLGFVEKICIKY